MLKYFLEVNQTFYDLNEILISQLLIILTFIKLPDFIKNKTIRLLLYLRDIVIIYMTKHTRNIFKDLIEHKDHYQNNN